MSAFSERVDAAITASGKTPDQIAAEAGTNRTYISRLRTGANDNPELLLLMRVARAMGTTVGALLGDSIKISAEDERELLQFRGWIDEKLATIDALREPNAVMLQTQAPQQVSATRIADRRSLAPRRIENPFDANVHLVLRALGESMVGAGILPDDTLYAIAPMPDDSAVTKIIACRIGEELFVKRLVSEHQRLFLLSAHPRYQPIAINPKTFEILGIVIGRTGNIR